MEEANECRKYQRRDPKQTPCYRILHQHLRFFISAREAEQRPLPAYVKEELQAFLECGILNYGFLRIQCNTCKTENIIAFSCKKMGFCPACCAKRMIESATHLVDNVLPMVPYRQFVITFPMPLRYWLQTNKGLYRKIHQIVIKEVHRYYKNIMIVG